MGNSDRKVHVVSLALLILASLLGMVACQTRPTAGSSQLEVSKSFTPENADHARLVGTLTRPAPKYKELLTDLVSIAFSPDGRLLASGSLDKTIQLWDVISHRHQRTLYDGGGDVFKIWSIAFSPDGRYLAAGTETVLSPRSIEDAGAMKLLDVASGRVIRSFFNPHREGAFRVSSIGWSPDGHLIAGSGSPLDNAMAPKAPVKLWETATGHEVHTLEGPTAVPSLAFSPDGRLLAAAAGDSTVRLWDVASGHEVRRLDHQSGVTEVAFAPDGHLLASGTRDGTVSLWELNSEQQVRTLMMGSKAVVGLTFSSDGRLLTAVTLERTVQLWNTASGSHVQTLALNHEKVGLRSVAFSPNDVLLATGGTDGIVYLWGVP